MDWLRRSQIQKNISTESDWKSMGCIKSIHVWNDRQEPWHGPCLFSNRGWPEWIELGHRKHINWVRLNEPGMHQVNPCLSPDRNRETRFLSVVKLNGPVVIDWVRLKDPGMHQGNPHLKVQTAPVRHGLCLHFQIQMWIDWTMLLAFIISQGKHITSKIFEPCHHPHSNIASEAVNT